jgi:hypothetical protein
MACLIAGVELKKVYREETGTVTIITWNDSNEAVLTDKEVTRCFLGNLEITEFKGELIPYYTGINLREQQVNEYLASKSIKLVVDYSCIGLVVEVNEKDMDISKLEQSIKQAQMYFTKLGITEKPKLMMFDYEG